MKDGLISIIVPAYNAETVIGKAVRSLMAQTYPNFEILVINDGSTDNTEQVVKNLAKYDSRVKVITKENGGVSSARNLGLDYAKGEYIAFVDADDWVEPDFCKLLLNCMLDNKVELSSCGAIVQDEDGNELYDLVRKADDLMCQEDMVLSLLRNGGVSGALWNKLFLHSIITENDIKFDNRISSGEDLLFIAKYVKQITKSRFIDRRLYHYVISNATLSHPDLKKYGFNKKRLSEEMVYEKIEVLYQDSAKILKQLRNNQINLYHSIIKELYKADNHDKLLSIKYQRKLRKQIWHIMTSDYFSTKGKISMLLSMYVPRLLIIIER